MNLSNRKKFAYLLTVSAWLVFAASVEAQAPSEPLSRDSLAVPIFKSRVVQLDAPATRGSVGNPDVADILILRTTQLYVLGKDLGTTNVLLWDRNDQLVDTVSVEVTHDLESLKFKLRQLLPEETIEVYSVQRSIALRGHVSSVGAVDTAVRAAEGYLAQVQTAEKATEFEQDSQSRREDNTVGDVINLLQVSGAQQVMPEVKVAEPDLRHRACMAGERQVAVKSMTEKSIGRIKRVRLLGHQGDLKWDQTAAGLAVTLPGTRPGDYAFSLAIAR